MSHVPFDESPITAEDSPAMDVGAVDVEPEAPDHAHITNVSIGIDIGSTTVKAVVCDPETLEGSGRTTSATRRASPRWCRNSSCGSAQPFPTHGTIGSS